MSRLRGLVINAVALIDVSAGLFVLVSLHDSSVSEFALDASVNSISINEFDIRIELAILNYFVGVEDALDGLLGIINAGQAGLSEEIAFEVRIQVVGMQIGSLQLLDHW